MQKQPSVLIISHQRAMRHLTERVCRRIGATTVTATSGQEASAIVAARGLHDWALVVIDTVASGQDKLSQPRMARQLLQEWTAASPLLPFVFIGPVVQKHALLRIRADIVRFVATPFGLHGLIEAIESCLPRTTPRVQNFSAPFYQEGTSSGAYHRGPNSHRLLRRDAAVQDWVAYSAFSAADSGQRRVVPHGRGHCGPDGA